MTGQAVARVMVADGTVTTQFADGSIVTEPAPSGVDPEAYAGFIRALSAQFHGTPGPRLAYPVPAARPWGQPKACTVCGKAYICDSTLDHGLRD